HFALAPHLERRNHAYRLRHRHAVGALRVEARVPNRLELAETLVAIAPRPDLADEREDCLRRVGPVHLHVVLDQATPARLMRRYETPQPPAPALAGKLGPPALEFTLRFDRVHRVRQSRKIRTPRRTERVAHRDVGAHGRRARSGSDLI